MLQTLFILSKSQTKPDFYRRLFAEIFFYLGQYKTENNWCAVAIFSTRSLDPGLSIHYVELQPKLKVVYLDELIINQNLPISLGVVQLVVDSQAEVIEKTPRLLQRVREEITDPSQGRKILDLIETVLVYKFTHLSREELETMFSLSDLKQTKVYQEAKIEGKLEGKIEGKLELLPKLLAAGLSPRQVAQILEVELDVVTSQVDQEGAKE
jgi:predicted transposase/invertase (TIGR01784 family)